MKEKNFLNNVFFRLLAPIVYGIFVYILILFIFVSIDQFNMNFFTGQVIIIIGLTYLISEFIRLTIKIIEIIYPGDFNIRAKIIVQLIASGGVAILITSIVMSLYFTYLIGIKDFNTELIIFNSIYVITSIIYNMLYFSIFFLHRLNTLKIKNENQIKINLANELKAYKNRINPEFLFSSFETLIGLSHTNMNEADTFVNKLSKLYRYILSHTKNELTGITNEFNAVKDFIELINYKYNGNVSFSTELQDKQKQMQIIPGSLLTCLETILKTTIISNIFPLKIDVSNNENCIIVKHLKNKRVIPFDNPYVEIENLNRAYTYFSKKKIQITDEAENQIIAIPVLNSL